MKNNNVFNRGLDPKALLAFKKYIGEQPWLQSLIQHKDGSGSKGATFFAIRDNCVNIYGHGGSLVRLTYNHKTGKILGQTHFKYLLRNKMQNGKCYIPIEEGGIPKYPGNSIYEMFVDSLNDGRLLLDQARLYAGEERFGVHQIVMANPNVLDTEIVFGKDTDEDEGGTDRIDFCALRRGDAENLKIVFYEAKHISNPELNGDVLSQLERYRGQLRDPKRVEQILKSYKLVCENIVELCNDSDISIPFLEFAKKAGENPQNLRVDPDPRLAVFGYNNVQKKEHLPKIKEILKEGKLSEQHTLWRGNPNAQWKGVKFD